MQVVAQSCIWSTLPHECCVSLAQVKKHSAWFVILRANHNCLVLHTATVHTTVYIWLSQTSCSPVSLLRVPLTKQDENSQKHSSHQTLRATDSQTRHSGLRTTLFFFMLWLTAFTSSRSNRPLLRQPKGRQLSRIKTTQHYCGLCLKQTKGAMPEEPLAALQLLRSLQITELWPCEPRQCERLETALSTSAR